MSRHGVEQPTCGDSRENDGLGRPAPQFPEPAFQVMANLDSLTSDNARWIVEGPRRFIVSVGCKLQHVLLERAGAETGPEGVDPVIGAANQGISLEVARGAVQLVLAVWVGARHRIVPLGEAVRVERSSSLNSPVSRQGQNLIRA